VKDIVFDDWSHIMSKDAFNILVGQMGNEWVAGGTGGLTALGRTLGHTDYIENFFVECLNIGYHTTRGLLSRHEVAEYMKAGPYVQVTASALLPNTIDYFDKKEDKVETCAYKQRLLRSAEIVADRIVRVNGGKLVPLDYTDGFARMTKGSNFGTPYFTSTWWREEHSVDNPDNWTEAAVDLYHWLETFVKEGTGVERLKYPAVVYSRVVPSGRHLTDWKPKARRTFAMTKYEGALSKLFSHPFLTVCREYAPFAFYSGNAAAEHLIRHAMERHEHVLSLDWSSFDQTVLRGARAIVKYALTLMFEAEYHHMLDALFTAYDDMTVFSPYGHITPNYNVGLPSGAGFTGIIGSLWNYIVTTSFLTEAGISGDTFFYGDDTLVAYSGDMIPMEEVVSYASDLGMIINAEKQEHTTGPERLGTFLQKRYIMWGSGRASKGIHPICRMAPRLIYSDVTKDAEDPDTADARRDIIDARGHHVLDTMSALEECKNHPGHKGLVQLVTALHPLNLDTRLVIDYEKCRNRRETGGAAPERGVELWETVAVVEEIYSSALEQDWMYQKHQPSTVEIDWVINRLVEFEGREAWSKGYEYARDQRLAYLSGQVVERTNEQRIAGEIYCRSKAKSLYDRVIEVQLNHGVTLTFQQTQLLKQGGKIGWNQRQQRLMSEYGQLSEQSRFDWIREHNLRHSDVVHPETKVEGVNRTKATIAIRELVVQSIGDPDDRVLNVLRHTYAYGSFKANTKMLNQLNLVLGSKGLDVDALIREVFLF